NSRSRSQSSKQRGHALKLDDGTCVELLRNAIAVRFDRAVSDEQTRADLRVAVTANHELEDLPFSSSELRISGARTCELELDLLVRDPFGQIRSSDRRISNRVENLRRRLRLQRVADRARA